MKMESKNIRTKVNLLSLSTDELKLLYYNPLINKFYTLTDLKKVNIKLVNQL